MARETSLHHALPDTPVVFKFHATRREDLLVEFIKLRQQPRFYSLYPLLHLGPVSIDGLPNADSKDVRQCDVTSHNSVITSHKSVILHEVQLSLHITDFPVFAIMIRHLEEISSHDVHGVSPLLSAFFSLLLSVSLAPAPSPVAPSFSLSCTLLSFSSHSLSCDSSPFCLCYTTRN